MKKLLSACTAFAVLFCTGCQRIPDTPVPEANTAETTIADTAPRDENGNILIRIATDDLEYLPPELETAMDAFNEMDNGYHIEPIIYSQAVMGTNDSGGLQTADMRLLMDVMQGESVDIVMDRSFFDQSNYDILSQKGAFVDLYTFLDGDLGISRSELNAHVLEIHENDGKLYQMPLSYCIETMVGDAEYVGTKENWTLDELISHWEQMPDGAYFCNQTNQWMVYDAIIRGNLGAFIDYKTGTCSFDSTEFINLLDFCNQFAETKYKVGPDNNSVYFLEYCPLDGFDSFHLYNQGGNRKPSIGSNYTFVGYPTESGNGSFIDTLWKRYSICATAHPAVQEGAWEFISYMLDADVQIENCISYDNENYQKSPKLEEHGFPINQIAFEQIAEGMIAHAGEPRVLGFGDVEEDVGYLTQEEYERLLRLINSLQCMDSPIDKAANTIIENEVEALFAGERTAEEVAKSIQGRMEIMISEKS